MVGNTLNRSGLLAAAALMAAGLGGVGHVDRASVERDEVRITKHTPRLAEKTADLQRAVTTRSVGGFFGFGGTGGPTRQRRAGYGWTNAHALRVARKKRNVRRFRAQARG